MLGEIRSRSAALSTHCHCRPVIGVCDQGRLGELIAIKATYNREPSLFPRQVLGQRGIDDGPRGFVERCGHVQALFWRHITVVIRDELGNCGRGVVHRINSQSGVSTPSAGAQRFR